MLNQFDEANEMKDNIILDNGSTVDLFMNKDFVSNIVVSEKPMELHTNTRTKINTQKATVPGFGEVRYDEDAIANIFSLKNLMKEHWVKFNSRFEDAFIVESKKSGKTVKFNANKDGLYMYKPPESFIKENQSSGISHNSIVTTVRDNMQGYTTKQIQLADDARKLYHLIGTPSLKNFKAIVKGNMIKNIPISVDDIDRAEKIYGPDIYAIKGKSTRSAPKPVVNNLIEIPKELITKNYKLDLCIDVVYVCGIPFLTGIDKQIKYRSVVYLDGRESIDFYKAINAILRKYNKAGFIVSMIHCDREFKSLMNKVIDEMDGVVMNFANPLDCIPKIE